MQTTLTHMNHLDMFLDAIPVDDIDTLTIGDTTFTHLNEFDYEEGDDIIDIIVQGYVGENHLNVTIENIVVGEDGHLSTAIEIEYEYKPAPAVAPAADKADAADKTDTDFEDWFASVIDEGPDPAPQAPAPTGSRGFTESRGAAAEDFDYLCGPDVCDCWDEYDEDEDESFTRIALRRNPEALDSWQVSYDELPVWAPSTRQAVTDRLLHIVETGDEQIVTALFDLTEYDMGMVSVTGSLVSSGPNSGTVIKQPDLGVFMVLENDGTPCEPLVEISFLAQLPARTA